MAKSKDGDTRTIIERFQEMRQKRDESRSQKYSNRLKERESLHHDHPAFHPGSKNIKMRIVDTRMSDLISNSVFLPERPAKRQSSKKKSKEIASSV